MSPENGLFLAFEGIDGAGKTTQALILRDRIADMGRRAVYLKEPTDGPWGRKIRAIAAEGREGVTLEDELDWFVRDRADDVRDNIAPALSRGEVVIIDRYFYSTIAYQSALGLDEGMIRERNRRFPAPDRVFILDVPVITGRERITGGRGERANIGYEQASFLEKVKANFDALPDANIVRIDGTLSLKAVSAAVWEETAGLL